MAWQWLLWDLTKTSSVELNWGLLTTLVLQNTQPCPCFLFFCPSPLAYVILVPGPQIKPGSQILKVWSLTHWTARRCPCTSIYGAFTSPESPHPGLMGCSLHGAQSRTRFIFNNSSCVTFANDFLWNTVWRNEEANIPKVLCHSVSSLFDRSFANSWYETRANSRVKLAGHSRGVNTLAGHLILTPMGPFTIYFFKKTICLLLLFLAGSLCCRERGLLCSCGAWVLLTSHCSGLLLWSTWALEHSLSSCGPQP